MDIESHVDESPVAPLVCLLQLSILLAGSQCLYGATVKNRPPDGAPEALNGAHSSLQGGAHVAFTHKGIF